VEDAPARRPMGAVTRTVWALVAVLALGGFLALGQWQVQRRAWKHDLIAQVKNRLHAPAVAAPQRGEWKDLALQGKVYAYRRITLDGVFLHQYTTLVEASTVLGRGWWVMAPLRMLDGSHVLINRGFVPRAQTAGAWRTQPQGSVTLTGLLRLSEPGGSFLRPNNPASGRWFSRDVKQIAAHHGLEDTAPYFVDVQSDAPLWPSTQQAGAQSAHLPDHLLPVPGLTVVSFPDNHLVYALTWYGLALMVACATVTVGREEMRLRRGKNRLTLSAHGADTDKQHTTNG